MQCIHSSCMRIKVIGNDYHNNSNLLCKSLGQTYYVSTYIYIVAYSKYGVTYCMTIYSHTVQWPYLAKSKSVLIALKWVIRTNYHSTNKYTSHSLNAPVMTGSHSIAKASSWIQTHLHTSNALILIPVSVLMVFLAISICIGKATSLIPTILWQM